MASDACLITAPTVSDFIDPQRTVNAHNHNGTQLGVLALAASVRRRGGTVQIIDTTQLILDALRAGNGMKHQSDYLEHLAELAQSSSAPVIGLSTICSSYPFTLRLASRIKCLMPDTCIVVGGPQASVVDEATLRLFPSIDIVVRGEADETFPNLLSIVLKSGMNTDVMSTMPGITFRADNGIVRTPNRPPVADLDSLPMPAFDLDPYIGQRTSLHLEIGRGCPYACTFCSTNDFFRRNFRLKSTRHMLQQMNEIHQRYGITNFSLVHDMYTVNRKSVVEFCESLVEIGSPYSWGCSARTDRIDDELIALMAKAGCRGIFFGIETGSQRLQTIIKKDLDLDAAWDRIVCTDRHGIVTTVALICGFPEESKADLGQTMEYYVRSRRLNHAEPQLSLLAPLAGTPIETTHRSQLTFDHIHSDMSLQGWHEDQEDIAMIKQFPDVFQNFYAVPTAVPRRYIREVRDFVTGLSFWFRWLSLALMDSTNDLLGLVDNWTIWQDERMNGGRATSDHFKARDDHYYSSNVFACEFLEYVEGLIQQESVPNSGLLRIIVAYERLLSSDESSHVEQSSDSNTTLSLLTRVTTAPNVTVKRFDRNLERALSSLRTGRPIQEEQMEEEDYMLVAKPCGSANFSRLSCASSRLWGYCNSLMTVEEIINAFARDHHFADDMPLVRRKKIALAGLIRFFQDGVIQAAA
jgi:radical SAM superfamily enzyme YgiQ (UPF0313 family)